MYCGGKYADRNIDSLVTDFNTDPDHCKLLKWIPGGQHFVAQLPLVLSM